MKNPVNTIFKSSKEVLGNRKYLVGFIVFAFVIISVFVMIPVFLISGNSLIYQLTIFTPLNYILLIFLSLITSLLLVHNIYIYKQNRKLHSGKIASGGISAFFAGLFGTAGCASCVAAIFGFLGTGTVFILLENQQFITVLSTLMILTSLYFSSRKINEGCKILK